MKMPDFIRKNRFRFLDQVFKKLLLVRVIRKFGGRDLMLCLNNSPCMTVRAPLTKLELFESRDTRWH